VLSHALDCQLYGLRPRGHHLTSILFHGINAALLFLLLRRLTGALWRSLFAALFFAWHPLRVESVAWIAERKDVLCGFFWLLALLAWTEFVGRKNTQNSRAKFFYGATLLAFALALLSKPMAVTLPFVLLLLDFWPLKRMTDFKFKISELSPLVLEKIPFFLLALVMSAVAFLVQFNGDAVQSLGNRRSAFAPPTRSWRMWTTSRKFSGRRTSRFFIRIPAICRGRPCWWREFFWRRFP
jgi:hypothetical protein